MLAARVDHLWMASTLPSSSGPGAASLSNHRPATAHTALHRASGTALHSSPGGTVQFPAQLGPLRLLAPTRDRSLSHPACHRAMGRRRERGVLVCSARAACAVPGAARR